MSPCSLWTDLVLLRRSCVAALLTVLLLGITLLGGCEARAESRTVRLKQQLHSLFELHTAEAVHRDVIYIAEQRSMLFWRTVDSRVLFAVDYRIRAGLDLSRGLRVRPVPGFPRRVRVSLPAAQVLSIDADESSIEQYVLHERGRRFGWLEIAAELEHAKDRVAAEAERYGLLERAEANARELARGLLAGAGFTDVEIRFGYAPADRRGVGAIYGGGFR